MKTVARVAHYLFLALTVWTALVYWKIVIGDGFVSFSPEEPGWLHSLLIHPVFAWAVLFLGLALIAKEFYVEKIGKRFTMDLVALGVIILLLLAQTSA